MLFMQSKRETPYQVSKAVFKDFVAKEVRAEVSDRDMELFLKANKALNSRKTGDLIDKADLLDVFEEPFRVAKFQFLDRENIMQNHREMQ